MHRFSIIEQIYEKDHYPLPLISGLLDAPFQAHTYSKIDLQHTYHLVHITKGNEWKMVMVGHAFWPHQLSHSFSITYLCDHCIVLRIKSGGTFQSTPVIGTIIRWYSGSLVLQRFKIGSESRGLSFNLCVALLPCPCT